MLLNDDNTWSEDFTLMLRYIYSGTNVSWILFAVSSTELD